MSYLFLFVAYGTRNGFTKPILQNQKHKIQPNDNTTTMASSIKNLSDYTNKNIKDIKDSTFAVIVSEWNDEVTESLYEGAMETLISHGADKANIVRKKIGRAHV